MNLTTPVQNLKFREYYYMVLRHRFYFFGAILGSFLISLLLMLVLPRTYRAETTLLIEDGKILNPLISGLAVSPRMSERMKTLREELLSWQRLTLLAERLKMNANMKDPYKYERLIKELREHIAIKFKGNEIITVRFDGGDPKRAQEIVQTLSDIVVTGNLTSESLEAGSAIRFIQDQLEKYRTKLETSEAKLRQFQEIYEATMPVAMQMNQQIASLRVQLTNLLVDNTEQHPEVIRTKQLIAELEKKRDIQLKDAAAQGLDINPGEFADATSSVPLQEQQLTRLKRNYAVDEQVYQTLLNRLETAKISETLDQSEKATKFRILEPARLPLRPVQPNLLMLLIGGLLVGISLGSILVYFLEQCDTSIRSIDEARLLFELPIMGWTDRIKPEELVLEKQARGNGEKAAEKAASRAAETKIGSVVSV